MFKRHDDSEYLHCVPKYGETHSIFYHYIMLAVGAL